MKKDMGTTNRKFLNKFQISRAERILKQEEFSISEVAYTCGFAIHYHFPRMFNRIMLIFPEITESHSVRLSPLLKAVNLAK